MPPPEKAGRHRRISGPPAGHAPGDHITIMLRAARTCLLSDKRPLEPLESAMHLTLDFLLLTAAVAPHFVAYRRRRVSDDWDPY